jgi:hypothetical protein
MGRSANWNLTSAALYGRIPSRTLGGTRVSLPGATGAVSSKLTPGFYEVYAVTASNTGVKCFVLDGATSSITASSKAYYIPADNSRIFEVRQGENEYIAAITRSAVTASLCIMKMIV